MDIDEALRDPENWTPKFTQIAKQTGKPITTVHDIVNRNRDNFVITIFDEKFEGNAEIRKKFWICKCGFKSMSEHIFRELHIEKRDDGQVHKCIQVPKGEIKDE